MGQIITIASQKGGTGKTTTAVNIAASLSLMEKRTLLIDCDPQGSATTGLGVDKKSLKYSLFQVLSGTIQPHETIVRHRNLKYLHMIPSCFNLPHALPQYHAGTFSSGCKQNALKDLTIALKHEYDFILIDSPPTLGDITLSALVASKWLLIPIQFQIFALEGLGQLLKVVQQLHLSENPELKIVGIVYTMHETMHKGGDISKNHPGGELIPYVFSTKIPRNCLLRDSSDLGKPAALCNIQSIGARSYMDLAVELMNRCDSRTSRN